MVTVYEKPKVNYRKPQSYKWFYSCLIKIIFILNPFEIEDRLIFPKSTLVKASYYLIVYFKDEDFLKYPFTTIYEIVSFLISNSDSGLLSFVYDF